MILTIENPEGLDLSKFVGWLCDRIEAVATDPVNQSGPEIAMWDNYLEENMVACIIAKIKRRRKGNKHGLRRVKWAL